MHAGVSQLLVPNVNPWEHIGLKQMFNLVYKFNLFSLVYRITNLGIFSSYSVMA
jgi:hypothetical protein